MSKGRQAEESIVIPTTRRKEPRSRISIQLKLYRQTKSEPLTIKTENISRYGACLIVPCPIEVGEVVTLVCPHEECEMRATVKYARRSEENWRVGIEFVAFPKKWLIMQLAVSAMLEGNWVQPRRRRARG
ncbi:MAG TPA: PilZ domain-containing protein [Blastocatellia bacterium]|nr:PilZ domain-containing protein [Blastocatellia bacterium]